jgi:ABC-type transport system involved in cytochrome bd biosynthesis fused ATPase/permease subunit
MSFDDNTDLNGLTAPESTETPPETSGNRTFVIVAIALGAIMLLTLVCIAVFGLVILPNNNKAKLTQNAQAYGQQTAMAVSAQQTMVALNATPTFTATVPPTKVPPSPTATQVIKKLATATPTSDRGNAATQTVVALYTKAALTQTALAAAPTALATSGFADEVGLPGLFALGGALIVIIFLARRLRSAS